MDNKMDPHSCGFAQKSQSVSFVHGVWPRMHSAALLFFELFVDLLSPLPWREMSRVDERPPRYSGLEISREKTRRPDLPHPTHRGRRQAPTIGAGGGGTFDKAAGKGSTANSPRHDPHAVSMLSIVVVFPTTLSFDDVCESSTNK